MRSEGKKDEDKAFIKRIGKSDRSCEKSNFINNDNIAQKYDQFDDFDELIGLMKTLNIVTFNRENWTRSFCTCSYNQKYYFCVHVIALSVNEGLTVIDNVTLNVL